MRSPTLKLRPFFFKGLITHVVVFVAVLGMLEAGARTPLAAKLLIMPSPGTNLEYVGPKFASLEILAGQESIDCLFMGSSMVAFGIDPARFSEGYADVSGQPSTCFNMGLLGATTTDVAR